MDTVSYMRFIVACAVVLGLIAGLAWVLRRYGNKLTQAGGRSGGRLSLVETCYLGPKHRLLLVKRDDVEHLILTGPETQVVVETGIKKA